MKLVIGILAIILFEPIVWAQDDSAALHEVDQKLVLLEAKVSQWEARQAQIIQKQAEIAEELQVLRVWIRRNRS